MAIPFAYNLRNLRVRWVTSLLTAVGLLLVTTVFLVMFAMGTGIERSLVGSGHPLNVIALRSGATAESHSMVTKEQVDNVATLEGIERDAEGRPLLSAELVVLANVPKRAGGKANVAVRGVGPRAREVRDGVRVAPGKGRWFTPGLGELVVGAGAQKRFAGLEVGDTPFFRGRKWTVVGVFEAGGQSYESEVWGDIDDLKAQFKSEYSAVLFRARGPAEVERLARVVKEDKRLKLDARSHVEYYRSNNQAGEMMKAMGVVMAFVLSIGAVFGAANTMYAAVAARTREIATMRVLGFSRLAIWLSFVLESSLLGLAGGAAGAVLAFAFFNGVTSGTVSWQSFSELAFQFRVTPGLMLAGTFLSAALGVAGGFLPAFRASRATIASSLRGL